MHSKKGFSLIELMIVVGIISVLVAIASKKINPEEFSMSVKFKDPAVAMAFSYKAMRCAFVCSGVSTCPLEFDFTGNGTTGELMDTGLTMWAFTNTVGAEQYLLKKKKLIAGLGKLDFPDVEGQTWEQGNINNVNACDMNSDGGINSADFAFFRSAIYFGHKHLLAGAPFPISEAAAMTTLQGYFN